MQAIRIYGQNIHDTMQNSLLTLWVEGALNLHYKVQETGRNRYSFLYLHIAVGPGPQYRVDLSF